MDLSLRVDGLDEREDAFVRAIIGGNPVGDASLIAGYSHKTSGYSVLRRPRVQRALHNYRVRVINTEGATLALRTMIELLGPKVASGTRFNAAKTILALAGHNVGDEKGGKDPPLHEMNEAQLLTFIEKAKQAIAEGGEAPVIHLIGDDSAPVAHYPDGVEGDEGEQ